MISNSQEADLKRERRSLLGKIKRRQSAIETARSDLWRAEMSLREVERQLAEYRAGGARG